MSLKWPWIPHHGVPAGGGHHQHRQVPVRKVEDVPWKGMGEEALSKGYETAPKTSKSRAGPVSDLGRKGP